MTVVEAAILGLLQGIAEFLPISSSGHLVLGRALLGISEPDLTFDIALHLASLGAVAIFFWTRLLKVRLKDLGYLLLATVPTALVGVSVRDVFTQATHHTWVVGLGLALTSASLFFIDWKLRQSDRAKAADLKAHDESTSESTLSSGSNQAFSGPITWKQAMIVGLIQSISILPGVSRSGSTVAAGLFSGLSRQTSFQFSFFLLFPAVFGAIGLELVSLVSAAWSTDGLTVASLSTHLAQNQGDQSILVYAVGMVLAFAAGLASLRLFQYILTHAQFRWFGVYTAVLSLISLFLL